MPPAASADPPHPAPAPAPAAPPPLPPAPQPSSRSPITSVTLPSTTRAWPANAARIAAASAADVPTVTANATLAVPCSFSAVAVTSTVPSWTGATSTTEPAPSTTVTLATLASLEAKLQLRSSPAIAGAASTRADSPPTTRVRGGSSSITVGPGYGPTVIENHALAVASAASVAVHAYCVRSWTTFGVPEIVRVASSSVSPAGSSGVRV